MMSRRRLASSPCSTWPCVWCLAGSAWAPPVLSLHRLELILPPTGARARAGDTSKLPVRLANAIVDNTMVLLEVAHLRSVWFVFEQPTTSWMFKLPCVRETFARLKGRQPGGGRPVVCQARGCQPRGGPPGVDSPAVLRICTWMGAFGHELPKCSHVVGTLPTLPTMKRARPSHLRGCEARPGMWRRTCTGVQCGRDLPGSAEYTRAFCLALYSAWVQAARPGRAGEEVAGR